MITDQQIHELITFPDGRQTIVSRPVRARVSVEHDDVGRGKVDELDVAEHDVPSLRAKLKTHRLQFDKLSRKVRAVIRARPGG